MECIETVNFIINALNFAAMIYLTYIIADSNRKLTNITEESRIASKPKLVVWLNNQDDKFKIFSFSNLGIEKLLIRKIEINSSSKNMLFITENNKEIDNILDTVISHNEIKTLKCHHPNTTGMFPMNIFLTNYRGDSTKIEVDGSRVGPYFTGDEKFFF